MTAEEMLETAIVEKKSAIAAGGGKTFDPTIIFILIPIVMELMKRCQKQTPASLRHRFGNRIRLGLAIFRMSKEYDYPLTLHQSGVEADHLLDIADAKSDSDLQAFIDLCPCAA